MAKQGQEDRLYIQQLCEDTGCSSEVMNNREECQEKVRDICAGGKT